MTTLSRLPRGLSLVELMVGMAVSLIVVGMASTLLTSQLDEQRRLSLGLEVEQDLRAAAELVARDLRRSGYWQDAATQVAWVGEGMNAYANVSTSGNAHAGTISYASSRDSNNQVDTNDQAGAKLDGGAVKLLIGGNWQALTDTDRVQVTDFQVRLNNEDVALADYCSAPCPAPTAGNPPCPPVQRVRVVTIALTGQSAQDAAIVRSLRTTVRLRNDQIVGACAA